MASSSSLVYNVSDLINLEYTKTFESYTFIIFGISILFLFYYAFLIIKCSNKQMKIFRFFMIIYIFCCFNVGLIILLWKPYRLFPFEIIYPTGLLSPMSSRISILCFVLILMSYALMFDALAIVVLERHFLIIEIIKGEKPKKLRIFIYFLLAFLFCLTFCGMCFNFITSEDSEALEILKTNVLNIQILFNFQPSLFYIKHRISFYTLFTTSMTVILIIYHFILAIWMLYANFNYSKNSNISLSSQSKKQFNLMLYTTLAQGVTLGIFVPILLLWMCLLAFPSVPSNLMFLAAYMEAIISLYPIFDVIIVISVVKTYRNETCKIFKQIILRRTDLTERSAVATVNARTRTNNNNNNNRIASLSQISM